MPSLQQLVRASVVRKFVMALSGIGLTAFLAVHLSGNLALYGHHGEAFNRYTASLEALGPKLWVLEAVIFVGFLVHVVLAVSLKLGHKSARGPAGYQSWKSKKALPSNLASRNMVVTGAVLLVFVILHVRHFKLGPGVAEGYVMAGGENIRDLHRLVLETFRQPLYVIWYTAVMFLLALHLRHGFWSAFQSLGLMHRSLARPAYFLGLLVALLLAGGFFFIPLYIYFVPTTH